MNTLDLNNEGGMWPAGYDRSRVTRCPAFTILLSPSYSHSRDLIDLIHHSLHVWCPLTPYPLASAKSEPPPTETLRVTPRATATATSRLLFPPVAPPHPLSRRDRHLRATATATLESHLERHSHSDADDSANLWPFTPRDREADRRRRRRDSHHDWPFTYPLTCPPSGVSPSLIIPLEKTLNLSTLRLEKTLNHCRDPNISRGVSNRGFRDNRISGVRRNGGRINNSISSLNSLLLIGNHFLLGRDVHHYYTEGRGRNPCCSDENPNLRLALTLFIHALTLALAGPTTPLPDKKLLLFILDRLQKKDTHGVFSEPVDPEEVTDGFWAVRKKLDKGLYPDLEQFEVGVAIFWNRFLECDLLMEQFETIFTQARSEAASCPGGSESTSVDPINEEKLRNKSWIDAAGGITNKGRLYGVGKVRQSREEARQSREEARQFREQNERLQRRFESLFNVLPLLPSDTQQLLQQQANMQADNEDDHQPSSVARHYGNNY
ncbi:hypothetical protein Fmac_019465 [Flemingia macrophylla]|uniref:Uncharacterized protein n=1 Tax=Flemingia macrophylla TaxID=520843 RepID=A0ABD1M7X1_9FABA